MASRFVDGDGRRREGGIGERTDRNRDHVRRRPSGVEDGGAAVGAEREGPRLALVGDPEVLRRLPRDLDALAREARLITEGAPRPPLAGNAMTHGDPDRIAL